MPSEDTVLIPLRAKDGSIRAYAIVDAADVPFINQWRWSLGSRGYAMRATDSKGKRITIYLHRVLLGLARGDVRQCDHINRTPLDNRRCNLRIVTVQQNQQNRSSVKGSSSKHRGVSWDTYNRRWHAAVEVKGRTIVLGSFRDEEEAAEAARQARARLMPYATD